MCSLLQVSHVPPIRPSYTSHFCTLLPLPPTHTTHIQQQPRPPRCLHHPPSRPNASRHRRHRPRHLAHHQGPNHDSPGPSSDQEAPPVAEPHHPEAAFSRPGPGPRRRGQGRGGGRADGGGEQAQEGALGLRGPGGERRGGRVLRHPEHAGRRPLRAPTPAAGAAPGGCVCVIVMWVGVIGGSSDERDGLGVCGSRVEGRGSREDSLIR